MKRFILVTLFLSFFGFTSNALASWESVKDNLPYAVPWEWNNTVYTHIAMYNYVPGSVIIAIYCPDDISFTADYNYNALAIRSTTNYICRMFESDDNGETWLFSQPPLYYSWSFSYARNNQTPTSNLSDFIRANKDVSATYTENWNGAWGFNSVTAGDKLVDGSSFGGFVVTKQLSVTRSPEMGGGVIVTVPPGFPEYQCGIDSCEVCDFDVDFNAQVTLEAQANSGYVFSHWEINDLAMADVDGSIDVTMDESKDVAAVFKPVFQLPLDGYTSTSVPISAVLDHSLSGGFYAVDGRNSEVEAFNGLIANGTQHSYNGNVYCYDTTNTNPFPGLNYIYTYPLENRSEICYDEHPGFDFAVGNGTNVLAPFAGKLYWATTDPVNNNPSTYGTFYIDHENGYTTWFLHCSGLTSAVATEVAQNGYAVVAKGDHIAESSNKGPEGTPYHLHFEVRKDGVDDEHVIDPYGWELWEE